MSASELLLPVVFLVVWPNMEIWPCGTHIGMCVCVCVCGGVVLCVCVCHPPSPSVNDKSLATPLGANGNGLSFHVQTMAIGLSTLVEYSVR